MFLVILKFQISNNNNKFRDSYFKFAMETFWKVIKFPY